MLVFGTKLRNMYSDPEDDSTDSEAEEVDIEIIYSNGVERVDNMLDDLWVGGDMGIYRMFEHTFGDHIYQILNEYAPLKKPDKILKKYMYPHEYENFKRSMRNESGTPMDDVVGLIALFGKFFNKDDVNIPSFLAYVLLETCKPVNVSLPKTSKMIRRRRAQSSPLMLS